MSTDKQIAANRLNAQKSTGPRTPEGRAAVRLNGVKHGLYAETLVLPGESESEFTALLESYEAEHQPATPTEEALVQQLTMAMWRLRRLYHAEAAFLARERKSQAEWHSKTKLDDRTLTGMAIKSSQDTVTAFRRQEASLERTFYRAMHELQRLGAKRPAKLALDPHPAVADPQGAEINAIPTPDQPPTTPNPAPDPATSPQTGLHVVPPTENMK
jgi:soluble lytic murein transglycosylase-like protein